MTWKAKVDGLWYEVEDVEDQGNGKQNIYYLKNKGPVRQEQVEDLDVAAHVNFLTRLERLANKVLAARKDVRKKMLERQKAENKKKADNKKPKKSEKPKSEKPKSEKTKKLPPKKTKNQNIGLNKFGNLPSEEEKSKNVFEPEVLDQNNQPIQPKDKEEDNQLQVQVQAPQEEQDAHVALNKLRGMENPKFFIIMFRNNKENENTFLSQTRSLLQTKHALLFYVGDRGELDGTYTIFIASSKAPDLEHVAKRSGSNYMMSDLPEDFFSQDSPFDGMSFPELNQALAGDETKLKRELNEAMRRISDTSPGGQVSALRMAAEIPLDYSRFLSINHRPIEYYLGGHPPNAGAVGSQFVLATEAETRQFMKIINGFKPPAPFFNDLYYVSDIDPDFKDFNPHKIIPPRALILQAKSKFDVDANVTLSTPSSKSLMKENKEIAKDSASYKDVVTQLEMLEAFVRVHMKRATGSKPGKFNKRKYFIGNQWVHFNKDQTVAILWGARTSSIPLTKQQVLGSLPFVKDAILTFLK